jgi:hypothetical protein
LGVGGLPSGKKAFGQVHGVTLNVECEVLIPVRLDLGPSGKHPVAKFHSTGVNETEPFINFIFWTTLDYDDVAEGVKYLMPLYTRIESGKGSWPDGAYALSDPKDSRIVIGGLVLEQTGRAFGEYRRLGTFHPHFSSEEEVQKLVKLMKTFILGLKETDYEKKYIDEKTSHERCTITII